MRVTVQIVNAFIDGEQGGNPAGVVVDANGLNTAQKLAVAQKVGLSETAFVSRSTTATFKLEFFTPNRQIAHCGHATVATFSLLRQLGMVGEGRHSKETIDGNRDIVIERDMAFMEQHAPRYQSLAADSDHYRQALRSIGIDPTHLLEGRAPCVVNTGNNFLLIAVQDAATLAALVPDPKAVERLSEALDLIGYYVFTRQTQQTGRVAGTRMFAPRYGIAEEAGTGMAAGPLACYLHDQMCVPDTSMLIEQGWLMPTPSPSVIRVDLDIEHKQIKRLMAGGRAKSVNTVHVDI